jgi:hypothetical protein
MSLIAVIVVVVVLLLMVWLLKSFLIWYAEKMNLDAEAVIDSVHRAFHKRVIKFRILIGLTQVLSRLTVTYRMTFPPIFTRFLSILELAEFVDPFTLLAGLRCLWAPDYYLTLMCKILGPLTILVLLYLIFKLGNSQPAYDIFLLFLYVAFPSFCNNLFRYFDCREYEDNALYLVIEPTVYCDDEQYTKLFWTFVMPLSIALPIGIPLWYYADLRSVLSDINDTSICEPDDIPDSTVLAMGYAGVISLSQELLEEAADRNFKKRMSERRENSVRKRSDSERNNSSWRRDTKRMSKRMSKREQKTGRGFASSPSMDSATPILSAKVHVCAEDSAAAKVQKLWRNKISRDERDSELIAAGVEGFSPTRTSSRRFKEAAHNARDQLKVLRKELAEAFDKELRRSGEERAKEQLRICTRMVSERAQSVELLWGCYLPSFWWMEVYEMCRKFVLTALPLVSRIAFPRAGFEPVLGAGICAFHVAFIASAQPFIDDTDDFLSILAQVAITVVIGVGMNTEESSAGKIDPMLAAVLMIGVCAPVTLILLYSLVDPSLPMMVRYLKRKEVHREKKRQERLTEKRKKRLPKRKSQLQSSTPVAFSEISLLVEDTGPTDDMHKVRRFSIDIDTNNGKLTGDDDEDEDGASGAAQDMYAKSRGPLEKIPIRSEDTVDSDRVAVVAGYREELGDDGLGSGLTGFVHGLDDQIASPMEEKPFSRSLSFSRSVDEKHQSKSATSEAMQADAVSLHQLNSTLGLHASSKDAAPQAANRASSDSLAAHHMAAQRRAISLDELDSKLDAVAFVDPPPSSLPRPQPAAHLQPRPSPLVAVPADRQHSNTSRRRAPAAHDVDTHNEIREMAAFSQPVTAGAIESALAPPAGPPVTSPGTTATI